MARKAAPVPIPAVWSSSVGELAQRVTVREEPTRGWRLYLWWRTPSEDGKKSNWGKESLRTTLRDAECYFLPDAVARQARATAALAKKYGHLYGGETAAVAVVPVATSAEEADTVRTIGATKAAVIDLKKGLYPHKSQYRAEVIRALDFATLVWKPETLWTEIQRSDWVSLMRERLAQLLRERHQGVAGTQHTIIRLITVVRWLKEEGRIPETVPMPKRDWKEQVAKEWMQTTEADHEPVIHQPRYTLEELLAILAAAWKIDPRFGLLAHLGAGLRLGQVRRCKRSHLKTVALDEGDVLELAVHARGKKGGTVVELTPGQRAVMEAALAGLYAPLEARWLAEGADYALFPAGRLMGLEQRKAEVKYPKQRRPVRLSKKMRTDRSVSDRWWQTQWGAAESLAKVPHLDGRASYGGRRIFVDEALDRDVSDRALKSLGGWTSAAVPKGVYADKESRKGRREARDARVSILGEGGQVGIHSGARRTTGVPDTQHPVTESGTPGEAELSTTEKL